MLFSSVPFLCYFLIAVFAVYFLVPNKAKNAVLLCASLFFYYYGEPRFCIIMVSSALVGYLFGLLIHSSKSKLLRKLFLVASIVFTLAPLILFKYCDFFISNINLLLKNDLALLKLVMPLGISFYTFQILSYTVDVYRGDARVQKNPINFLTYVTLFPQLIAGPIVRYQTIQDELDNRSHTLSDFSAGITRLIIGLGKKVLIANSLAEVVSFLTAAEERTVLSYWLCAIAFTLQIYFDFSGYSDMAIGLGRMFGFHFCENFNHPFVSGSITEFWRRWHMSLGTWFRDYVYIPLGGNKCSKGRWLFNILVVWFLTGFWHGAEWNFIVWGLYFALFLLIEKLFLHKLLKKLPKILRVCYVMFFIVISFVIFNANNMGEAVINLAGMFSFGTLPFTDALTNYYLSGSIVLILISAVGSTPLPAQIANKLKESRIGSKVLCVLEPLFVTMVLLVVLGYLVDGSFSPFLYFRF